MSNNIIIKAINKGLVSILDQGLFSGVGFILSILLARWLLPRDYGSFSVATSIFLLAAGIYSSIVLEPMSVYSPKTKDDELNIYYGSILVFHFTVSIIISIILFISAPLLPSESVSVIRIMAITVPLVLAFWLTRWSFYARSLPGKALMITTFYSIGIIFSIILLRFIGLISANMVFIVTGSVSILSSLSILKSSYKHIKLDTLLKHSRMHWDYGRWIVLASVLQWISTQYYLILIASHLSLNEGAGYRSIQNLAQPLEQISTALGLLFIPWFARKYSENSISSLKNMHWINWILGIFGVIYLALAWVGRDTLIHMLYQGKYDSYIWLVPFVIAVPMIISLSKDAQIGVRVLEKPSILLIAYGSSAIVTMIVGPILIITFGLKGAVLGRIISSIIFSVVIYLLYRRVSKSNNYETLPYKA